MRWVRPENLRRELDVRFVDEETRTAREVKRHSRRRRRGYSRARAAGRFRLFRYEARCWRDGVIPDAEAVESPRGLSGDPDHARQLLELVRQVPTPVWGRDEPRTGEMWNSNSLISCLITRSNLDVESIHPPRGGRAPGWHAGIVIRRARRRARHPTPASRRNV
jgi:hypothetical protein